MQTVSTLFDTLAKSSVRPIAYQARVSFDKQLDPSVTFFTLDESLLDGPDILAPDSDSVITEWDKYVYRDYTDRIVSIEINREELDPYSVVQAFADVTFDNFDGYFTPNSKSPIAEYILPRRPFRLLGGFGNEVIPQFVGLSTEMPTIDREAGTARFHLVDFLTYLFDKEIGDTIMLIDNNTGDILDYLFQEVGLLPNQYVIDETSFNRIPFFYAEKGQSLGSVIKELIRAEQGRLFMDEAGIIRYLSRQSYSDTVVQTFREHDVEDYKPSDENDIINYVKITADVLAQQPKSSIWQSVASTYIKAGDTAEVWAAFSDPVVSVTTPVTSDEILEDSYYQAFVDVEDIEYYPLIGIQSIQVFAKTVKIVFENNGSENAYVKNIELWGVPVKVEDTIEVIDFDQDSVDKFEEQRYEFKTNYIQDQTKALSEAAIMVEDYKDYGAIIKGRFIGNAALQIGDVIALDNVDGYDDTYTITGITNIWGDFRFRQDLEIKKKVVRQYFILSSDSQARSLLDGTDALAP